MTDGLREAYRHQLIALRALRRQIAREDRMVREILDAVRDSDEAQMTMGGTPCGDIHPDFAAQTHCCYVPPEDVEHIERCGE